MSMIELANGPRLHVSVEGLEGAPWVILSNSMITDLSLWNDFATFLRGRYRLLRYDQRGHGQSSAPTPPYRMTDLVEDIVGLMDRLGIDRAHHVGISMGGSTGWGLAQARPDRLLSLTVCAAGTTGGSARDWEARLAILKAQGVQGLVEMTLARWFTEQKIKENGPVIRHVRDMIVATSAQGFEGCAHALTGFDYAPILEHLKLPVLLVAGGRDGTRPQVMAAEAQRIPGGRFVVISDAGHLCNLDSPGIFNAAVGSFIDNADGQD